MGNTEARFSVHDSFKLSKAERCRHVQADIATMEITPMSIFTAWLGVFSISFTLMPLMMVLDWRRRGTAEGFSSVNFVLPMLM
ncbi:hypothetical protein GCK32_019468 [Trichostrongylus colubriformis]|uniref:Uncharacterized protein n=1 Tax=Trichostrongylus colubriformis TaxID=6319 RepID=A0AAN8G1Y6_TRICO